MPIVKPISGHASATFICAYLSKGDRALARDYINLDPPGRDEEREPFDWGAAMDETRAAYGNDVPWRGRRVRTYKHYVVSPDPKDGIGLGELRELASSWAEKHFGGYEVAIVYHDDNDSGIPHAHVVVNNTELETGRRLQDPDPAALNRSLQSMAAERNLRHFGNAGESAGRARGNAGSRARPASLQREYVRRAEAELVAQGKYSWTADMRSRVRIARIAARSEGEFRSLLSAMGVEVADNSPRAARKDWVYSFAEHPSRRISGEKLGLAYGREHLQATFALGGARRLADAGEREIARIAKRAVELRNLEELEKLSRALSFIEANGIATQEDLDDAVNRGGGRRAWTDPGPEEAAELSRYMRLVGILPEKTAGFEAPASMPKGKASRLGKPLSGKSPATRREDDRRQRQAQARERSDAR